MKIKAMAATLAALALSTCMLAGCTSGTAATSSTSDGQPAPMPANHVGRYADLGDAGCYGCHGANEKANPQLVGSVKMPEDHYYKATSATLTIDPVHNQCITCHPQG